MWKRALPAFVCNLPIYNLSISQYNSQHILQKQSFEEMTIQIDASK